MHFSFLESQTELRGDHSDLGAAVHGKGSGAGVVLQPTAEGEEDLLPGRHLTYKIAQLQFQTGERLLLFLQDMMLFFPSTFISSLLHKIQYLD